MPDFDIKIIDRPERCYIGDYADITAVYENHTICTAGRLGALSDALDYLTDQSEQSGLKELRVTARGRVYVLQKIKERWCWTKRY